MLTAAKTAPRLPTLILLSGLSVLPVNMFLPSLPSIAAEFRADPTQVSLAIAGYASVAAALQLVLGPLSDRFGRRPVILVGLAIFGLASLGCALSTDIYSFLAFRMLQGTVAAGYVVSMAAIRDTQPAERAASLIGTVAMVWALAPMLGPVVGGLLEEFYGWRASFWSFLGLGGAVLALTWLDFGETNANPSNSIASQLRSYSGLLGSARFWSYALCMAFSTGAFYAFLAGAPLVAAAVYDMPPAELGIAMGSITAGFVFGSFLASRTADRFPLVASMLAGRITACVGLGLGLILLLSGVEHVAVFFGSCMFVGLGNGITMPSANAGAMSVRPDLAGSAAGLSGALMVGGGAVIAAVTGAVLGITTSGPVLLSIMLLSSFAGLLAALATLCGKPVEEPNS